jgi:hypothetical protein
LYSPKIDDSLIPIIYQKAKSEKKPMTKIVNQILKEKLCEKVEDKPTITSTTVESTTTEIKSLTS